MRDRRRKIVVTATAVDPRARARVGRSTIKSTRQEAISIKDVTARLPVIDFLNVFIAVIHLSLCISLIEVFILNLGSILLYYILFYFKSY